jgi:transposase
MRKIREVLRLTHELGLSVRQVSKATGVGKTAVGEFVARAKVIGITWPVPSEISDAELERRLFTPAGFHDRPTRIAPDWAKVHEELKRRGVTRMILWEEHRAEVPDGHGYARFCQLYRKWRRRLSPTMRQTHVAGDKLFVDWAGGTVPIIDVMTGEVHEASIFVAVLGVPGADVSHSGAAQPWRLHGRELFPATDLWGSCFAACRSDRHRRQRREA